MLPPGMRCSASRRPRRVAHAVLAAAGEHTKCARERGKRKTVRGAEAARLVVAQAVSVGCATAVPQKAPPTDGVVMQATLPKLMGAVRAMTPAMRRGSLAPQLRLWLS